MDHPTSVWAMRYGVPDPGPAADDVLDLAPSELTRQFRAVSVLAGRIEDADARLQSAMALLGAGWSGGPAVATASALLSAARTGRMVLRVGAAAATGTVDSLESARSWVLQAYGLADVAIAHGDLLRSDPADSWPTLPDPGAPGTAALRDARISVVHDLAARVDQARNLAAAAVVTLHDALADDPRHGLAAVRAASGPLSTGASAPGAAGGAAGDDLHNRAALGADLASANPVRARFAAAVAGALARAAATVPPGTAVQLLVYDPLHPAGQGGAAIAVGDVSTADDIAVVVPGVGNSPSDMSGTVDAATQLSSEAAAADPQATVAAVAWLDYDIPLSWMHDFPATPVRALTDSLIAADDTEAIAGGARLAAFADRLRAEAAPSAHLTLVGHSYGSVVVSQAALRSTAVDDVVLLAAPGVGPGVRDSGDYAAISGDHVFALSFDDDPVTKPVTDLLSAVLVPVTALPSGSTFGTDPAAAGFGAQVIDAPSNVPVVTLGPALTLPGGLPQAAAVNLLTSMDQHPLSNYLGGAAGLAVGAVVVGRYTAVRTKRGR